jgi:hypothetical protein
MGKLKIEGLDLHGESEMKRIWKMNQGQPYNPDYPDAFLKAVREMFDELGETKAETRLNERDHTVDVTLNFKGIHAGKTNPKRR